MRWLVGLALLLAAAGCSDSDGPKRESRSGSLDALDGNPTEVQTMPNPPEGMEFVGMGSVVVAVPEGMDRQVVRCSMQRKGDAADPSCLRLNDHVRGSLRSRLTVTFIPEDQADNFDYDESPFTSASGLEGLIADACVGYCVSDRATRLAIPSEDVVLVLEAGMRGQDVVERVAQSVSLVPEGYLTIPPVMKGMETQDAVAVLSARDFQVDAPTPSPAYYFWDTTPAAGAVVEEGSTVIVHVGDG